MPKVYQPADYEIGIAGYTVAHVSAAGAALRSLVVGGRPLVAEWDAGQYPPAAAGAVLAPWPNRVRDAVFVFRGSTYRLEPTEPERATALHGFTTAREFDLFRHTPREVCLATVLGPEPGWPWRILLTVTYRARRDGVAGTARARNLADTAAPFAFGVHTYLKANAPLDDEILLADLDRRLVLDERLLPTGMSEPADARALRLREGLRGVSLDDAFRVSGRTFAVLADDGYGVRLDAGEGFGWLQLYTLRDVDPATGFPGPGGAIAVEPMSAPPDALNSGTDLVVLEPGDDKSFEWSVRAVADEPLALNIN